MVSIYLFSKREWLGASEALEELLPSRQFQLVEKNYLLRPVGNFTLNIGCLSFTNFFFKENVRKAFELLGKWSKDLKRDSQWTVAFDG